MGKITILLVSLLFGMQVIFCFLRKDDLWPRLSCHKGYLHRIHNHYCEVCTPIPGGFIHSFRTRCYKACLLQYAEIVNTSKDRDQDRELAVEFGKPENISMGLNSLAFIDLYVGNELSLKLWSQCKDEVIQINEKRLDCPDWDSLYTCVENVLNCTDSTPAGAK